MRANSRLDISPWVRRHRPSLASGTHVLDIACGNGRHTRYLAEAGFSITAVDRDLSQISRDDQETRIELIEHDLENNGWPFGKRRFGGIVVTNYLFRPLLPVLVSALDDNGVLIYDTFAMGNEQFGKPANPDYLLQPAELLTACGRHLHVIAYDHGRTNEPHTAIRQRICAQRRN